MQLCPFPVNPGLKIQLNDPLVLLQKTLSSLQLWIFCAHSSISVTKLEIIDNQGAVIPSQRG